MFVHASRGCWLRMQMRFSGCLVEKCDEAFYMLLGGRDGLLLERLKQQQRSSWLFKISTFSVKEVHEGSCCSWNCVLWETDKQPGAKTHTNSCRQTLREVHVAARTELTWINFSRDVCLELISCSSLNKTAEKMCFKMWKHANVEKKKVSTQADLFLFASVCLSGADVQHRWDVFCSRRLQSQQSLPLLWPRHLQIHLVCEPRYTQLEVDLTVRKENNLFNLNKLRTIIKFSLCTWFSIHLAVHSWWTTSGKKAFISPCQCSGSHPTVVLFVSISRSKEQRFRFPSMPWPAT